MAGYRDPQAELRIDTLEARLAERDAALRAREVELVELHAELEGGRGGADTGALRAARLRAQIGGFVAVVALAVASMGVWMNATRSARDQRLLAVAKLEIARLGDQLAVERARAVPQAPESPAPRAPSAPAADDDGFDRSAAQSALAAAAADVKKRCGAASGTPVDARVKIVFAPSGDAASATVMDPALAGTPAGACVVTGFRGVHVPPFGGSAVAVSKSISIVVPAR